MWDRGLLPKQIEAAKYLGTHARLLAGPGTGKTLVISRKIEYLISEEHIEPERILALTFTRAAAYELLNRVQKSLGTEFCPKICTLHSFALSQLLKNQKLVDQLPKPLRIADDWEEKYIIRADIKNILGLSKKDEVKELFLEQSANWESLSNDQNHENLSNPRFLGAWLNHRKIFGYTLRSELVYQLQKSLEYYIEFSLDPKIDFLIVDEYQDLNLCDLSIIKSIENKGVELYIAGDDDQSIYGFRKAHPNGIRNFPKEFLKVKNLYLDICMRCDPKILALAEFVAKQDTNREKKEISSGSLDSEGVVALLNFENQQFEAEGIAKICRDLINSKSIKPTEILILSRSNHNGAFSKVLEVEFNKIGVPFATKSEESPLYSKKRPQIISFLRLLRNEKDNLSWRTILKTRNNAIGDQKINYITKIAEDFNSTFFDAISKIVNENYGDPKINKFIENEFNSITSILENIKAIYQPNLEKNIPIISWLPTFIKNYLNNECIANEFIDYISRIVGINTCFSINDFLNIIETENNKIEQEREDGKVNFLTMHKAKGLDADAVFIIACKNEYVPGAQTSKSAIDDERRLLYVSLTRARHYLFISYCNKRIRQHA